MPEGTSQEPHEVSATLQWWLTERRERLGLTFEDLGRATGTLPSIVEAWSEGHAFPNKDQILSLARHLRDPDHPPGAEPQPEARVEENSFVMAQNDLGVGKCIQVENGRATVEYFDTVARQVTHTFPVEDLLVVQLSHQTRCYVTDEYRETWRMGRIERLADGDQIVAFPGQEAEQVKPAYLFVRWAKPVRDPIETLQQKGQETVFFRNQREPFVHALIEQRVASRGASGLISSNIDFYPHQVEVIRRVLEDPVQRYILADEVGLGKTIEAGVIIRQFLIDHRGGTVRVFVPSTLQAQWERELDDKFDLSALQGTVSVEPLTALAEFVGEEYPDLVVIDEAHRVAGWAQRDEHAFSRVSSLAHGTKRLLLLSATPAHAHEREFLAMLHLLDPEMYSLADTDAFEERIAKRDEVGGLLRDLVEGEDELALEFAIEDLRGAFPENSDLLGLANRLEDSISDGEVDGPLRDGIIREIRLYLKEKYRLHHRMLRNRRTDAYSGDNAQRSAPESREYGMDLREERVNELLDGWRIRALSGLGDVPDQDVGNGDQASASLFPYADVLRILLEVASSSLSLLSEAISLRVNGTLHERLKSDLPEDDVVRLKHTPLFEDEQDYLLAIKDVCETSLDAYDLSHADWLSEFLRLRMESNPTSQDSFVVFTNYTSVAERLYRRLTEAFGKEAVAGHRANMPISEAEADTERFMQQDVCRVLICDASAEEGRNLQSSDHIIHYDLPLSANRIEQRTGRLDRIGRNGRPMHTHVYLGPDVEGSLIETWYAILNDGFNVFEQSIASLQFLADRVRPELIQHLFQHGSSDLERRVSQLCDEIQEEKERVERQHEFEMLDRPYQDTATQYRDLEHLASNGRSMFSRVDRWITSALQFHRASRPYPNDMFRYEPDFNGKTLLPFDTILNRFLPVSGKPVTYHRSVAVDSRKRVGTPAAIFRLGHPFLDALVNYFEWDDRGRTYAVWRTNREWGALGKEDTLFFRFDFVVEADIAEGVSGEHDVLQRAALQRRADGLFSPRFHTVCTDRNGTVVTNKGLKDLLLAQPERVQDGGADKNIQGAERSAVLDRFIDPLDWPVWCQRARDAAEESLMHDPELVRNRREAHERAKRDAQDRLLRLRLRATLEEGHERRAKSYAELLSRERHVSEGLCAGVADPAVRLDSVGVIVLSGNRFSMPNNE